MKKVASVLLASALFACSGDDPADTSTSGGTTGSGGAGGSGGGSAGTCAVDMICLAVKPMAPGQPIAPGLVGVVWRQILDDDPTVMPLVGYDAPFDPTVARVEIPAAAIAAPPDELLFCERDCYDNLAQCPCLSDAKVGVAYVVVSGDPDGDGQIADDEAFNNAYGLAFTAIVRSETEQTPAPPLLVSVFPEGIVQGTRPYRVVAESGGAHDDLYPPMAGEVFDLNVCPAPGVSCDVPVINLQ